MYAHPIDFAFIFLSLTFLYLILIAFPRPAHRFGSEFRAERLAGSMVRMDFMFIIPLYQFFIQLSPFEFLSPTTYHIAASRVGAKCAPRILHNRIWIKHFYTKMHYLRFGGGEASSWMRRLATPREKLQAIHKWFPIQNGINNCKRFALSQLSESNKRRNHFYSFNAVNRTTTEKGPSRFVELKRRKEDEKIARSK